ncbi:hypothetical protein P7C71_g1396, partial [Lecanoromycetidae sp. Uapishka_2]
MHIMPYSRSGVPLCLLFLFQFYQNSSSTNLTTLAEPINPRFRIEVVYGPTQFNSISCLMTAVNALSILADIDYHGQVRELHYTMTQYPDFVIDLQPVGLATDVENRFAVWGLYLTTKTIVEARKSRECETALYWDEDIVGLLSFKNPGTPPPKGVDNGSRFGSFNGSISTNAMNWNYSSPDTQVDIIFHAAPDAPSLNYLDVFITVMATLKDLAQFPSTQRMTAFAARAGQGYDAKISFPAEDPPRTRPPYFQVRWAIEVVRQLPAWVLNRGRWSEVGWAIVIGGQFVGEGVLERGTVEGQDGTEVMEAYMGNVSVF